MTRDELTRLLEGGADPAERERLAQELSQLDDATRAALEAGWDAPAGPNVFAAAVEAVHPTPAPFWRRWWLPMVATVAVAASVMVLVAGRAPPTTADGLKGPAGVPSLGAVLVVLGDAPHRLAPGEHLRPGTTLGVRAVTSRTAWLALEERRGGAWTRVWPQEAGGARVEAGERELADADGAVVLRVEPRPGPWALRLVGADQPLDVAQARAEAEVFVEVAP